MWDAWRLLWSLLIGFFRSRASLEAENLALRQQMPCRVQSLLALEVKAATGKTDGAA